MVPLSQVQDMIDKAIGAKAAQEDLEKKIREQVRKEYEAENEAKKLATAAVAAIATAVEPVASTDPEDNRFGNLDKKERFDLQKLIPGLVLPKDKFVVVIQKHLVKSDGSTTEDDSARRAQVIDPGDYQSNTRPDKNTGEKIYDVLFGKPGSGGGWVTVHKPE